LHVTELELHDFRGYEELQHQFGSGTTVLVGGNGQGKTSLLEAIGWSATGKSFRGAVDATLVRQGCEQAIVRMLAIDNHGREQRIEAEIRASGRNRVLLNGRSLTRNRDRLDFLRITVFAPDDLELVKAGPGRRREYLDDLLAASAPRYRAARADYERVLKQRNALLRGGPRDPDAVSTLVVLTTSW
jgi:DNA replication and repair protein RecF